MDGAQVICTTMITSFFTFQVLFHLVSSRFSAKISTGFNKLSPQKKIEWNSRVLSTIHSSAVGILSLYILFFDECKADPLWGRSSLVEMNISISSGYLFSDLLILLLNWKGIDDLAYILHHSTALYGYAGITDFWNTGLHWKCSHYLQNFPGPFVNQRWFFEVLNYPKLSKANIINGILMTVVFFIVRVAAMPPLYYYIYSVYGTEPYVRLGRHVQYSWFLCCATLDVLNIMWMIRISKGCIKVITAFRNENAKNRLQNGKLD
ncbi:TLC domain-containing protein 4 [Suncus etruscus]|uniref:TLC domain-containing protein 4 n=1 Tax=Suncus etruscus TaxID=109475 RepID=UPI00210F497C|nr:TLC domain-containing protein 4 [Suncus etruscus]